MTRTGGAMVRPSRHDVVVDDRGFVDRISGELAMLPGVVAVALGGSRARGGYQPDSDWDLAVYYRQHFEPDVLRAKGWPGEVSDVGGWGGGVMNGGAWLTIDDRRVDVHYRDLNDVEHWCAEANAGRFHKELLLFYAAGIPTYVLMAELALNVTLSGVLPRPAYPDALASEAPRRWAADAVASLRYGEAAVRSRGDVAVGLADGARGLIEAAHGVLAARREWVVNEKQIVERAGLEEDARLLIDATTAVDLELALRTLRHQKEAQPDGIR
jgi:predicted nucleotidyltransferase